MIPKLIFFICATVLQSDVTTSAIQEAENLKLQNEHLELSKLTTILSIAMITILVLLTISLVKNHQLNKEVKKLKKNL